MSDPPHNAEDRDSDPALDRTVRLPSQADRTITRPPGGDSEPTHPPGTASSERTITRPPEGDSEATVRPGSSEPTIAPGAAALPIGAKRFGKFVLLSELGSGGMGTVYKARQTDLDRIVALKALHGASAAGAALIKRFQREARAAAKLDHPGIVRVYEVGCEDGVHFFTMELVEGENLLARVKRADPPLAERVRWIRDAARALHHAHQTGLVHRDVKPHNLLVDASGAVKVADFGLARDVSAGRGLTVSGEVMGTPHYMAPEQARGAWDQVGPRADVYSLGATLYELVAGAPPVDAPEILALLERVANGNVVPLRSRAPSVPRDLETIVAKALDVDPERRYPSAGAFAEDLDRFLRFEAILARPETWWERGARRLRRNRRRILVGAASLLLVAGAIGAIVVVGRRTVEESAAASKERAKAEAVKLYGQATSAEYVLAHGGVPAQVRLLTDAAGLDPSFADPCLRLGLVNEWTGHLDEAADWYRKAARRAPKLVRAQAQLAMLDIVRARDEGTSDPRWKGAMETLKRLEASCPKDPSVRLVRCMLAGIGWNEEGRSPESVMEELDGLARLLPEAGLLLAGIKGFFFHPSGQLGFQSLKVPRDLGAAYDLIEDVVKKDPLHIQARMTLGLLRYDLGDLFGAENDFRFVATHAPDWDSPHYYLGRVLSSQRKLPEAEKELREAIRLVPTEERHINYLGMVLGLSGKFEAALVAFDESLRLRPDNEDAIALRGMALYLLDRPAEAKEQIRRYASKNPQYLELLQKVDEDLNKPGMKAVINAVRMHLLGFQDVLFLEPKEKAAVKTALTMVRAFPRLGELMKRYQDVNSVHYEMQDVLLNIPRYEREIPKAGEFLTWLGGEVGLKLDLHDGVVLSEFWLKMARDGEILTWSRLLTAKDYLWRAGSWYRAGKLDRMQADLERAIKLEGSNARAQYGIATVYALKGEARMCADALTKARQYGWENLAWVETDADFAKVRGDEDVKAAVRRE